MLGQPVLRSVTGNVMRRCAGRIGTIGQPLNASWCGPNQGIVTSREQTMLERTRVQSPFYTAEHEAFRDVMRRFVAREIEPYAHEWDEAGEFPRELYRKASEIGLLGLGFPEEFGGVAADQFMK